MLFQKPKTFLKKSLLLFFILILFLLFTSQNNWMFNTIPFFLLTWMIFPRDMNAGPHSPNLIHYYVIFMLVELGSEVLAILQNTSGHTTQGALFSTNPVLDLTLAILYYSPIAILTYRAYTKQPFSTRIVFITSGIYGVLTEQFFRILLSFNLMLYVIVFILYGSFFTIPYLIYANHFAQSQTPSSSLSIRKIGILLLHYLLGFLIAFFFFALYLYTIKPLIT